MGIINHENFCRNRCLSSCDIFSLDKIFKRDQGREGQKARFNFKLPIQNQVIIFTLPINLQTFFKYTL